MSRTPENIECALNEEVLRVEREKSKENSKEDSKVEALETLEPPAVKQAIRDILSLEPGSPIPATKHEIELFSKIYCLMSNRNRKWLSESHVALPYAHMSGSGEPREAALKSRLSGNRSSTAAAQLETGIALRNYFMQLLQMCLPQKELDAYPHLLSLFDNGFSGSDFTPVKEVGAWYVLTFFQQNFFQAERSVRPLPPFGSTLVDLSKPDYILGVHEKIFSRLPGLVASSPWRTAIDEKGVSSDSLFSRLMINVALNRLVLEQWAYARRVQAAAPMQLGLIAELEKAAPKGFANLIQNFEKDGVIDFSEFTKAMLPDLLTDRKDILTPNIIARIEQQSDAIIASASLEEFSGDEEVNLTFMRRPEITKAMAWLALVWSYLHNGAYPEDDPAIHTSITRLISRRSAIVLNGQHMVSLRRLVSSLLMTQAWALPSIERARLHIQYVGDVRALLISTVQAAFKGASLAQWESVLLAKHSPSQVAYAFLQNGLPARSDDSGCDRPQG